jgi:hypothetical protein
MDTLFAASGLAETGVLLGQAVAGAVAISPSLTERRLMYLLDLAATSGPVSGTERPINLFSVFCKTWHAGTIAQLSNKELSLLWDCAGEKISTHCSALYLYPQATQITCCCRAPLSRAWRTWLCNGPSGMRTHAGIPGCLQL